MGNRLRNDELDQEREIGARVDEEAFERRIGIHVDEDDDETTGKRKSYHDRLRDAFRRIDQE